MESLDIKNATTEMLYDEAMRYSSVLEIYYDSKGLREEMIYIIGCLLDIEKEIRIRESLLFP